MKDIKKRDIPYSAQECYSAIVSECTEGLIALCEMHARPYADKQKVLKDSAYLIESWAARLRDSV